MGDRHQFRAKWHDYNGGIYFVTISAYKKLHIFGRIVGAQSITSDPVGARLIAPTENAPSTETPRFIASELGKVVEENLKSLPGYYNDVEVWNYVIMPNHIHIVIAVGARLIAPEGADAINNIGCLKPPRHGEPVEDFHHNSRLATIIGAFKAGVTRTARAQCSMRARLIAPLPVWQRNFHEHIIRNQRAFDNIMNYIDNNVINWSKDCFYE